MPVGIGFLGATHELGSRGWYSVEVFDFELDGETAVQLATEYLHGLRALGALGSFRNFWHRLRRKPVACKKPMGRPGRLGFVS